MTDDINKDIILSFIENNKKEISNHEAVMNSLEFLFKESSLYKIEPENIPFKLRNIHSPEFYFQSIFDDGDWNKALLSKLLSNDNPRVLIEDAKKQFDSLNYENKDRLKVLYVEAILDKYFGKNNSFNESWFLALLDNTRFFLTIGESTSVGVFSYTMEDKVRIGVLQSLRTLSPLERANMLEEAAGSSNDITLVCQITRSLIGDARLDGAKARDEELNDYAESIRQALLTRTRMMADTGDIWFQYSPYTILWFWRNATDTNEVEEFLIRSLNVREIGKTFLLSSLKNVLSTSGNYEKLDVMEIEKLINYKHIEDFLSRMKISNDEDDREFYFYIKSKEDDGWC